MSEPYPCGHQTRTRNCGGCDPGAVEFVSDDGGPLRRVATFGMCTACGSVEVRLMTVTGTRDLSYMGESPNYPTGCGCEVCA